MELFTFSIFEKNHTKGTWEWLLPCSGMIKVDGEKIVDIFSEFSE